MIETENHSCSRAGSILGQYEEATGCRKTSGDNESGAAVAIATTLETGRS